MVHVEKTYHAFIRNLERTRSGHLIVDGDVVVVVGNQVAVEIIR